MKKWRRTGKFLDVGYATGFFIYGIHNHSDREVYGTDFGESVVRFAKEKLGLNVHQDDLAEIHFPDEHFDYVHVNNVLEYIPNPFPLLKECRRIVKRDGILYLSVPNGFVDSRDLIDFYAQEKTLRKLFGDIGFDILKTETYSIKRGLQSIGILPRKKDYFPKTVPETASLKKDVVIPDKKKHNDFYYRYRFWQGNLQHIPGLHIFGLDFLFLLKKK